MAFKLLTLTHILVFKMLNTVCMQVTYVEQNGNVSLTCDWNASITQNKGGNLVTFVDSQKLHPEYENDSKLSVNLNLNTRQITLEIKQFSSEYTGIYTCIENMNGKSIDVRLKKDPTNLTIVGESPNHFVYSAEDSRTDMICKVSRGDPEETLTWFIENQALNTSDSGTVIYSLVPKQSQHLRSFTCRASVQVTSFSDERTILLFVNAEVETSSNSLVGIITPTVVGMFVAVFLLFTLFVLKGKYANEKWFCWDQNAPLPIDAGIPVAQNNAASTSNEQQNDGNEYSTVTRKPNFLVNQTVSYSASQRKPPVFCQKPNFASTSGTSENGKASVQTSRKIPHKSIQLNYAEVHFDPTSKGRRIVIAEENEKSPYADIDFTKTAELEGLSVTESNSDDDDFCDVKELKRN